MNIWERFDRAMTRASGAHTEGDTAYDDLRVFKAHAEQQRLHVSRLQSKIARQAAVIDGRCPVSKERDYWKAEAEKLRVMYRSLRQSMMGTYGKFSSDSHEADAMLYLRAGRDAGGRAFYFGNMTVEHAEQLREQMRDAFSIFDVEPVKPTLRERIGDAWIDFQFWIADRLEDAAEWLRAR